MDSVGTAEVRFTKIMGKWVVTGPSTILIAGTTLDVNKRDGTAVSVYIRFTSTLRVTTPGMVAGHFTESGIRNADLAANQTFKATLGAWNETQHTRILEIENQLA